MNTDNLALRPNCLLTRFPIVFINPPRSVFWHEKLGGWYQDLLADHGYKVLCPVLSFRNSNLRNEQLTNWLQQQKDQKFHFILTKSTHDELSKSFDLFRNCSFTYTDDYSTSSSKLNPSSLIYAAHSLFCRTEGIECPDFSAVFPSKSRAEFDRLLDRCIELAENDHI